MIFLDANIFLRVLVQPTTSKSALMAQQARDLFRAIDRGDHEATTSEAVIAEVAFVLASKRQYDPAPEEIAARLRPLLSLPHLHLPRGRARFYDRAFELWAEQPKLGFVDALTAATLEQTDDILATFDSDFDKLPGITRWTPALE